METLSAPVTLKNICYTAIFCCAECGQLTYSERSDALTCSSACRVRAHRRGTIERLRGLLRTEPRLRGMTLPFILQMDAVVVLRPDLVEKMFRGELTLADTRAEMHESYWNKAMSENNIEKAQGSSYIAECQNLHLEKES